MSNEAVVDENASVEAPETKAAPPAAPIVAEWIPEDLRSHKSLTKFKEPGDVAKAYVSLESMLGKRIEVPGDDATPEAKAAWRAKIGVPETPDGYDRPEAPEGVKLREDLFADARNKFHEVGISKAQAKVMTDWFINKELEMASGFQQEYARQKEEGMKALDKQWGAAAPRNIALCQRVVAEMGGPELKAALNETGAGNDPRIVSFLAKIGRTLEEDNLIAPVQVGVDEKGAAAEITKIRSERMAAKGKHPLDDKKHPEHAAMKKKYNDLFQIAHPGQND